MKKRMIYRLALLIAGLQFAIGAQAETLFVTGANRGLGLGWVQHFAAAGDSVIATCRKPTEAKELAELAAKYDGLVRVEQLDVVDEDSISALGKKLTEEGIKIDLAVNNAGVTDVEPFGAWTKASFEFNIGVNTIGPALVSQMLAPHLNNGAILVNITSGAGSTQWQNKPNDYDAYGVSKAGLNHLTKRLSVKLRDRNVIVVAIHPGGVITDMNPNGKLTAEESVDLMTKALAGLTREDSGSYINYKGQEMAW